MISQLLEPFFDENYVPVLIRSVGAFSVAFFFLFIFGRAGAVWLYRRGMRDRVRDYDDFYSRSKSGTPTMGGLLIVGAVVCAAVMFGDLRTSIAPLLILTTLWFGAIGAIDDLMKVRYQSSDKGMSRGLKIMLQSFFALGIACVVTAGGTIADDYDPSWPQRNETSATVNTGELATKTGDGAAPEQLDARVSKVKAEELRTSIFLPLPLFGHRGPIDLGFLYLPFVVFVIVAIANAINFADGLDGLAVLPAAMTTAVFGLFAYLSWSYLGNNLGFVRLPGSAEIVVFAAAVVGACFGFLWFNSFPAQMFMGDTGSQALGGAIGAMAVLSKQELLFLIAGGLFVFEAFSVFFQDYIGIRWIGRRYFYRAPAHHSYQHQGLAETKVVMRFWIMSLLCAVISVATLKLR